MGRCPLCETDNNVGTPTQELAGGIVVHKACATTTLLIAVGDKLLGRPRPVPEPLQYRAGRAR
jgi:hypothetical protein